MRRTANNLSHLTNYLHEIEVNWKSVFYLLFLFLSFVGAQQVPTNSTNIVTNSTTNNITANSTRSLSTRAVYTNESTDLWPINVLVILPKYESDYDKFGLTIDKVSKFGTNLSVKIV